MRRLLLLILLLSLAVTGCARNAGQVLESSPPSSEAPSPTPSESPSPEPLPVALEGLVNNKATADLTGSGTAAALEMQLTDFAFDPTFVKVAPGANVKVMLKNAGALADHTFTIDALAVHRQLKPGEEAEVVFQLPSNGAFRFYCRLHADKGMQGAFFFNPGDPVSTASVTPPPTGSGKASSTRRPAVSSNRTSTTRPITETEDLVVPDVDINGTDKQGTNARSSKGSAGLDGSQGAEGQDGVPGARSNDVVGN